MPQISTRLIITIFLCNLQSITINAQDYFTTVQHYTTKDGLADNYVSDIFQDSKGFMWIPTTSGINRFDGHEFIRYSKEKNGLSSNYVEKIMEDKNGKLWIISRGKWNSEGLAFFTKLVDIFDPVHEQSVPFEEFVPVDFKEADIRGYLNDHEKNIWFSTRQGALYKYDGSQLHLIFRKDVVDNWNGLFTITTKDRIGYVENELFLLMDQTGKVLFELNLPYYMRLIYATNNGGIYAGAVYSHIQDDG